MGNTENLHGNEASKKIKELAEKVRVCLFTTDLKNQPLSARPMSVAEVDEDGCLWFFSQKGSEHNQHITADNHVQLFFSNTGSSEYLSIFGTSQILVDHKKIEKLW